MGGIILALATGVVLTLLFQAIAVGLRNQRNSPMWYDNPVAHIPNY